MSYAVVIPTYNRQETVVRALDSVFAQSIPPGEVIVVDDGSQDGTSDMLRARFPSVTLIEQENRGVSAARNVGIRASMSDWIALLDSDDAWLPKKIQRQFETLATMPNLALCHTEEIWIRNGVRVNQMKKHAKSGGRLFERSLKLCCISPSSVLMHRRLFDGFGLFDESLPACEDYDLWLRITAHEDVAFVETPMTMKYGGHEDQLSRAHWGMDRFRIYAIEKALTTGRLTTEQRRAALRILIKKLKILIGGASKRENRAVVHEYSPKLDHWSQVQGELDVS